MIKTAVNTDSNVLIGKPPHDHGFWVAWLRESAHNAPRSFCEVPAKAGIYNITYPESPITSGIAERNNQILPYIIEPLSGKDCRT
jgi:hypothetical protein